MNCIFSAWPYVPSEVWTGSGCRLALAAARRATARSSASEKRTAEARNEPTATAADHNEAHRRSRHIA